MNEKVFGNGEIIFSEGDIGSSFFQILEGTVGVYVNYGKDNQRKLVELTEGQYFGEMAVIETAPRTATIVAEKNARVAEIPEEKLNEYFAEDPDKILALMKHLGSRIRALTAEYEDANALIKEMQESTGVTKNEGLLAKIKKHLTLYSSVKKNALQPSAESLRDESFTNGKSSLQLETYKKGTIIFKKGETGKCMYAVHGGSVGIYSDYGTDKEKKLTDLFPGTFFGEMGMIEEEERSATAVADSDETYVEIIHPDDLKSLFTENPIEVEMILRHLSNRLRKLTYNYIEACRKINDLWNS